jgi:undecaprenyl-diphosphatase
MAQDFIEILILSAVQGVSEFLPISSSAHLILISNFYNFSSSSLFIDIGLHLGSLFAIVYYFKKDLLDLRNNHKLLVLILVGSIPLIIFGYIIYSTEIVNLIRNIEIIAWTTLFFGLVLFLSDKRDTNQNISTNLNVKTILFIGLFQILALVPGVSRAGISLTAARFLKFNRVDSSKIAFLLSIPALAGASFLGLKDAVQQSAEVNYLLLIAITFSFIFSFITVKYFIRYVSNFSLTVFVIYRIFIALILLLVIYFPH